MEESDQLLHRSAFRALLQFSASLPTFHWWLNAYVPLVVECLCFHQWLVASCLRYGVLNKPTAEELLALTGCLPVPLAQLEMRVPPEQAQLLSSCRRPQSAAWLDAHAA